MSFSKMDIFYGTHWTEYIIEVVELTDNKMLYSIFVLNKQTKCSAVLMELGLMVK